jgi:hypothetical protein
LLPRVSWQVFCATASRLLGKATRSARAIGLIRVVALRQSIISSAPRSANPVIALRIWSAVVLDGRSAEVAVGPAGDASRPPE